MFKPTTATSPEEYLALIDEPRRSEVRKVFDFICKTLPQFKPYLLSGMISFGSYHYKYASGREGDWAIVMLASQKNYISIYVCATDGKQYLAESYKEKLPKASIGKSCVRFKKFEDIDFTELGHLISEGAKMMNAS